MTEIWFVLLYFLIGLFVGFVAGAFGIGGGVVMVPTFLFLFPIHGFSEELIPKFAIGTSLFASVLASSSGALTHLKNKNLNLSMGVLVGSFAVLSASVFSRIAIGLEPKTLKIIFSFVLIIVTIRLLTDKSNDDVNTTSLWKYSYFFAPLLGIVVGSLSAFAGIGGGIIAVPILHYIFKLKFKASIGTSNLIIVFSTLSASLSYIILGMNRAESYPFTFGFVFLIAAIPAGIGTMISARWGANFTHRTKIAPIKILFAILIIAVDIKILFDVFD
ncbi:MAG: sulfite exporter TauE/SafE family protein [Ignavibacteria bacterium]|nr:sulfite exporter TauE/SafE family protein [Ignavibacteria bacterium]